MAKKKKNVIDVGAVMVYSTNSVLQQKIEESLPPNEQKLKVRLEKNHRGGKTVTVVSDFEGNDKDLEQLGKELKAHCGTGGSVKDGQVLIQGDHATKVMQYLLSKNYKNTKRAGG